MTPVIVREQEVEQFLTEHPSATVAELIEQYPDTDVWMLRKVRREFQQDRLLDEVQVESIEMLAKRAFSPTAQNALRSGFFRPLSIAIPPGKSARPIWKKAGEEHLILTDIHAPDHDPHALDVAIQVGQSLALDSVIIGGDGFDCHALSRYTPSAHRPFRWVDERQLAVPVFAMLRQSFAKLPMHWIHGNHDVRPEKFLSQHAPQLQGAFTLPQMLGIDGLDFEFPEDNRVIIGNKLLVVHGTRVRSEAGVSVQQEVKEAGMSVVMGHVHRRAIYDVSRTAQRLAGEQSLFGVESGCLCNLWPDYLEPERTANWQHGAVVVTRFDNGLVFPEPVRIDNGHAFFRGRIFSSRLR